MRASVLSGREASDFPLFFGISENETFQPLSA
jgi:hypothetical protein